MTLVGMALLASGTISLVFSYRETTVALASLQEEKAVGAAARIEQYLRQVTQQLQYAALLQMGSGDHGAVPELRRRRTEDHRGQPRAAGHREDPEPPRTGSTAAAPGPGA